ncbi:hypothetical protein QF011_000044 [Curtobacterium flaccumfaciens]|nr:hypothetical protein [Curtobacterium flaccumfaciens]
MTDDTAPAPPQRPNTDGTFKHIQESDGGKPKPLNDDAGSR